MTRSAQITAAGAVTCDQITPIPELVASAVRRHGSRRIADAIGLSVIAIANVAAGGRYRKGTALALEASRSKLEALLSDSEPPRSAA